MFSIALCLGVLARTLQRLAVRCNNDQMGSKKRGEGCDSVWARESNGEETELAEKLRRRQTE